MYTTWLHLGKTPGALEVALKQFLELLRVMSAWDPIVQCDSGYNIRQAADRLSRV